MNKNCLFLCSWIKNMHVSNLCIEWVMWTAFWDTFQGSPRQWPALGGQHTETAPPLPYIYPYLHSNTLPMAYNDQSEGAISCISWIIINISWIFNEWHWIQINVHFIQTVNRESSTLTGAKIMTTVELTVRTIGTWLTKAKMCATVSILHVYY